MQESLPGGVTGSQWTGPSLTQPVITGMSLVADQYNQIHTDGSKQGFAS